MQRSPETQIREKLNIPADAKQVILFAESSHWDPNWLQTSEDYFTHYVQSNIDQAIEYLEKNPRRKYSIECAFFIKMYWDRNPDKQERIRTLMNAGQLWMTSSGVTTADTLLPTEESLLRDFLIGQQWLREIGVTQEPDTAYFTDSFGCTPFLPTLLNAAGFSRTAFTRVDGMYFAGCDFESSKNFPRKGSSAELLRETLKTQDFIWRDSNGHEVLCHWNAFNYGQGDMLAARGLSRMYFMPYFIKDPSARNIRNKINHFVNQLSPLAKTPYMFCPIGFDFVPPIESLVELLDRYNQQEYAKTGVWAVNATLDDYLGLVNCYREQLPVVEALDPNPYWSGFYAARPYLKKIARRAVNQLVLTEQLSLHENNPELDHQLKELWWKGVSGNHHDLITGTSPDAVMEAESYPWLERVIEETTEICEGMTPHSEEPKPSDHQLTWTLEEHLLQVCNKHYCLEIDPTTGSLIRKIADDKVYPLPYSNDLVLYADSGGLWRMGHEFKGGYLKETLKASQQNSSYEMIEETDRLVLSRKLEFEDKVIQQYLIFYPDSPLVFGQVIGRAPAKSTLTIRFQPKHPIEQLRMGQPGGIITRETQKIYTPTFWPMQDFCRTLYSQEHTGIVLYATQPTAVAVLESGEIEMVALRNAIHETAFGFIGIPANPASGFEKQTCVFEYAFDLTDSLEIDEAKVLRNVNNIKTKFEAGTPCAMVKRALEDQIQVQSNTPAKIIAFKKAHHGKGFILRLRIYNPDEEMITIKIKAFEIQQATLCDSRERDISSLNIVDGQIMIPQPDNFISLRIQ